MRNWRHKVSHWWNSRRALSAYLDLALSSDDHRKVWQHVARCSSCREGLSQMSDLRDELRATPPAAVPSDLAFNIRVRLAQERYHSQSPTFWWRLRQRVAPFAAQVICGTASAIFAYALFLPSMAVPSAAYQNDVPISWSKPARLVDMGPVDLGSDPDNIVVQVLVDPQGRVADYSILSGHYSPDDVRELRNRLTFTVFDPATIHGRPTPELRLIAFNSVRVRG